MKLSLLTIAAASIFAVGCGRAALEQQTSLPASPAVEAQPEAIEAPAAPADETEKAADAPLADGARKPGDFVVYRFSGSFRKTPLTLTERVVARQGNLLTVDMVLQERGKKHELRVQIDEASAGRRDVVAVFTLEGGSAKPATMDAYEAFMAKTTLAADQNEALLGAEDLLVDVGGQRVPAHKTSYRVRIGKKRATLKTMESSAFAWGDVGGEITTDAGKVMYRAEVLETGHDEAAAKAASVAAQ